MSRMNEQEGFCRQRPVDSADRCEPRRKGGGVKSTRGPADPEGRVGGRTGRRSRPRVSCAPVSTLGFRVYLFPPSPSV